MVKQTFKMTKLGLVIAAASVLAACDSGGSSGSSGGSSPSTSNSVFSGTVADGYLVGADVCLDLNLNKECDNGEPQATTTTGGEFIIEAPQSQIDTYPLVVKIVENVTIDEDFPNDPIQKEYSMTAPVGYSFVSPLTTMVQQVIEDNPDLNLDDAEDQIQTLLGTSLDLSQDYVDAQNSNDFSSSDQDEFDRLHKVAQVTARVLQNTLDDAVNAIDDDSVDFKDIMSTVSDRVFATLEDINDQVSGVLNGNGDFDPDQIAESDVINDQVKVDPETIAEEVAAHKAEQEATDTNLVSFVTEGINWFESEEYDGQPELYYGTFTYNTETGETTDVEYEFNPETLQLEMVEESDDDSFHLLTSNGWILTSEKEVLAVNEETGVVQIQNVNTPELSMTLSAKEFPVTDLTIASVMKQDEDTEIWSKMFNSTAIFEEGSKAFKMSFTVDQDQYQVDFYDDCQEGDKVGGLCNYAEVSLGEGTGAITAVETLSDLTVDIESDSTNLLDLKAVVVAYTDKGNIYAELISDGNANFYEASYSNGDLKSLGSSEWNDETVHGETVRVIEIPEEVFAVADIDEDEKFVILADIDNHIRKGFKIPKGFVDSNEIAFNQTAKDQIVNAFNPDLYDEYLNPVLEATTQTLQACETGNHNAEESIEVSNEAEFNQAVEDCGGSDEDFVESELIGKTFLFAGTNNLTIEFEENNEMVISETVDGEEEIEVYFWSVNEGAVHFSTSGDGYEEQSAMVLLESAEGQYSVKGYTMDSRNYLDYPMDGTRDIWSEVLLELTEQ